MSKPPKPMKIGATMKPGQHGTLRLLEKYGDRLVCVRYRYDDESGKRYTTVEIVEESVLWNVDNAPKVPETADMRLGVRIDYWEHDLREQAKAVGAIWRPRQRLWEMRYEDIVNLGLESRVVSKGEA